MIEEILNWLIGIAFVTGSFLFAYVSSVINYETKAGKPYRMFWESKEPGKCDKQGVVKYNKGDNT